jgi:NADH:ubiquinone oxidoreductase subunit E
MDKLESILGIKNGEITADRKFSLDATRCIGACGLAPVLTVNEEVYGRLTPDMIQGIIDKYNK